MKVEPAVALVGHVAVPGDKSISHRAVLIGALGEDETRVRGLKAPPRSIVTPSASTARAVSSVCSRVSTVHGPAMKPK